jgi:phage terminase large subunit GpA-like protein
VDTGGHHTNQAYAFCAGRPGVFALKGASKNARDHLPLQAGNRRKAVIGGRMVGAVQLYLVGTHALKKQVYFGLSQTLAGVAEGRSLPGSLTLDPGATEQDFEQITAEVLLPPDPSKRRKDETWEALPGKRNEQLDLAVYGLALAWSFLPDQMTSVDWERLIAARRRDPSEDGALPLEKLWGDVLPTPSAPALSPAPAPISQGKTGSGAAAASGGGPAAPGQDTPAHGVRDGGVKAAILRLAALNRGETS